MGFRTAPAYVKQAGELLAATIARAETHGVRDLRIPIADGDDDQYNLLAQAGFTLLSRIADGLRDDQGWRDLLWMTCRTTHHMSPARKQETFYAERETWQHDRLAKSREIDPRAN
jgi:transposase